MKIYTTIIRPVSTYSSETWTLTAKDENNLRIFERQILRKIFGPVNIDNIWRIWNDMAIDKLMEGACIVRLIKAQRIKWLGHIQRMDQERLTRKLLDWKTMKTRPLGRPRQRWQEDVMEDFKKLKIKTGRKELRTEELGETWLRRRKPTEGCNAKWWWCLLLYCGLERPPVSFAAHFSVTLYKYGDRKPPTLDCVWRCHITVFITKWTCGCIDYSPVKLADEFNSHTWVNKLVF